MIKRIKLPETRDIYLFLTWTILLLFLIPFTFKQKLIIWPVWLFLWACWTWVPLKGESVVRLKLGALRAILKMYNAVRNRFNIENLTDMPGFMWVWQTYKRVKNEKT